jgi:hypothetical protein
VPDWPTAGIATAHDASATVSWTAPASDGGAPIHVYVITAYVQDEWMKNKMFEAPATMQIFDGLTNGTEYRFFVRASNEIGIGPYSMASNPVTPTA